MTRTAPQRSNRHRGTFLAGRGGTAAILLVLASASLIPVAAAESLQIFYTATPRVYRTGDDPAWAAVDLADERAWSGERPREPGNWWIRTTLSLDRDARADDDPALRVFAPGAIEVYWDGRRVGGDGVVGGDATAERPGRHGVWVSLDRAVVDAGDHVVAVRVSSWRVHHVLGPIGVLLLNRDATERVDDRRTAFFLFCAGVLLLAGLVFSLLYRPTGARRDTLLFAMLTLLVGLLLLLEYAKFVHPYPYTWHFPRLVAISSVTAVVGSLLPLFVAVHLDLRWQRALLALLLLTFAVLFLTYPDPDEHSLNILRVAIGAAFVLALVGVSLRRRDAPWILAAATVNLIPGIFSGFRYADHWFFVGFLGMVAVLLLQMVRTLRRNAREREEALLRSERLKYELLRKTIQPHFLMNSLAVAISHIEEEPARGIEMLRDLAAHLEAFFAVGERSAIPLDQELGLCRKHVRTMAHLLDRPLELAVEGNASRFEVPPGVLLTLVENAITHGHRGDDGLSIEVANRAQGDGDDAVHEGAGLRFVRAQLARQTEAIWTVDYGRHGGVWHTRLECHRR